LRSKAAVAAGVAAVVAIASTVAAFGFARRSHPTPRHSLQRLALPRPVKPAFTVPTPRPLAVPAARALWAPVVRPVVARAAPRADAPSVAGLERETPEGTANIVLLVGRAVDATGHLWVRARLPVLPNNTTGWVPRSALGGVVPIDTHLVVDLTTLTATLFRDGHSRFEAPVGVGTEQAPTPRGEFYVRDKLTSFSSPFYGPVAFGTSARSAVLTDWPAGGYVGIHGTSEPQLIPGRISHGCIRMRNADILRLAKLMPVGTPLTIR
jgi:lipoprotein-anchoring transpeptidase ErfK/SrfK